MSDKFKRTSNVIDMSLTNIGCLNSVLIQFFTTFHYHYLILQTIIIMLILHDGDFTRLKENPHLVLYEKKMMYKAIS